MDTRTAAIRGVKAGLIGGAVSVYIAAIGLIERFDPRDFIVDLITLGYVFVIIVALVTGYLATRRRAVAGVIEEWSPAQTILTGVVAGVLSSVVMLPFLLFIDNFAVRDTLVNISENLVGILTFDEGVASGFPLLALGAIACATGGAALRLLHPRFRQPLLAGLFTVLFLGLMEPLLRVMLDDLNDELWSQLNLDIPPDWLYESGGLTLVGAIVSFVIGVGVVVYRGLRAQGVAVRAAKRKARPPAAEQRKRLVTGAVILLVLLALPQFVGSFPSEILGNVGVFVLLGLGLNIVVGFAGMLDLGYVAFYAIGAYSMGVLTSPASPLYSPELSFWAALPVVIVITTIAGVLLGAPVLRLRGDYLAIVTLGFGEIIRVIVISDWAAPLLGGAQGLLRVPAPTIAGTELRDPQNIYYLILACVLLTAYVAWRVKGARIGRAWNAMREDEPVAEAMGISIIKSKLLAFGLGAALASFGGAIFAAKIGSLFPNTFTLIVSINVLALIVLGGMGSIPGIVVGSFVLVGIPEVLREFEEYRLLFYGAILMAVMILRPEGVLPDVRRAEELHEFQMAEDEQYLERTGADTGAPVVAAIGGGEESERE